MSRPASTLEANVRILVREATAKEHTQAQVYHALNDVLIDVYDEISMLPNCGWTRQKYAAFNIVAGTGTYSIPAGVRDFSAIQVWDGQNWLNLDVKTPQQWEENPDPGSIFYLGWGLPVTAILYASTIELRPIPTIGVSNAPGGGGCRFVGNPEAAPLVNPTDTSGLPAVVDPVIEKGAAALLMLEEGNPAAAGMEAKYQANRARVINSLSVRTQGALTMNIPPDDL